MIRPYTAHHLRGAFVVRDARMMDGALDTILDPSTTPPGFFLTPDEFTVAIQNGPVRGDDSADLFFERLRATVRAKTGQVPTRGRLNGRAQLVTLEIETSAPPYIQESPLPWHEKYAVWKTEPTGGPLTAALTDEEIETVRRQLAREERLERREKDAGPEDAVLRAFALESRKKDVRAQFATSTEAELAELVANTFPIYDAKTDGESIATLAATLRELTKGELMVLAQVAEWWQWEAGMVTVLRRLGAGGRL